MTPVTLSLLGLMALITFLAFRDARIFSDYSFRPDRILGGNEWIRMISSGFLHANWMHFAANAFSLYCFGPNIEAVYGPKVLGFIFLASVVGGNVLSLFLHRKHAYVAVGASGGVCGVIFASLFLIPGSRIMILPIPIPIPAWIYAIGFLLYSYFGMRRQSDNIGHDAHFGGAIVGVLLALLMFPDIVLMQRELLVGVLVLSVGALWFLSRQENRGGFGRWH